MHEYMSATRYIWTNYIGRAVCAWRRQIECPSEGCHCKLALCQLPLARDDSIVERALEIYRQFGARALIVTAVIAHNDVLSRHLIGHHSLISHPD